MCALCACQMVCLWTNPYGRGYTVAANLKHLHCLALPGSNDAPIAVIDRRAPLSIVTVTL